MPFKLFIILHFRNSFSPSFGINLILPINLQPNHNHLSQQPLQFFFQDFERFIRMIQFMIIMLLLNIIENYFNLAFIIHYSEYLGDFVIFPIIVQISL